VGGGSVSIRISHGRLVHSDGEENRLPKRWPHRRCSNHMPLPFEFLVPQRPLSLQAKSKSNLRRWKDFVRDEAKKSWVGDEAIAEGPLALTLVYLCGNDPADIDNIIKPIQDSLVGLVYEDDELIADVDSHRRDLEDGIDITDLPKVLQETVARSSWNVGSLWRFTRALQGRSKFNVISRAGSHSCPMASALRSLMSWAATKAAATSGARLPQPPRSCEATQRSNSTIRE